MKILIVGSNRYPRGDAGSLREETFANMLRAMGHAVRVVGLGKSTGFAWKQDNGVTYLSLRSHRADLIGRALDRLLYFSRLKKYVLSQDAYDALLITGGSNQTIVNLKKYARKDHVRLIHDSVEWYSPEQFRAGTAARAYRDKNRLNTRIIDDSFRVIAISSYLKEHFTKKGIKTVRIPVILDAENYPYRKRTDPDKVVFMYAGMPGKKDYLSVIVKGFLLLDEEEKKKCELRLVGVTKKQLTEDCGVTEQEAEGLGDVLQCLGRVSHQEVRDLFEEADFSVFLRNAELRYAKAGFPTKFAESLALGTPVICNISSDLGLYAKDGINTLICSDCSAEAMKTCIRKALGMSVRERESMQVNARKTFEQEFDYRKYFSEAETVLS